MSVRTAAGLPPVSLVRTIIGVDPGAAETGIICRRGPVLLDHYTICRKPDLLDLPSYLAAVCGIVSGLLRSGAQVVAVEDVVAPTPHLGLTNPSGAIGAAAILGAVIMETVNANGHAAGQIVLVRPNRNGSGPLAAYPDDLRPTRGRGRGADSLRHERSAWDVAGAAATILRQHARKSIA